MIPRLAQRIAKLIAVCILIAATWHAIAVVQELVKVLRNAESEGAWLGFAAKVAAWALAITGAIGLLEGRAMGYYVLYLATVLSVVLSASGHAFSYIPFEQYWLPESLTVEGREWIGICLVNLSVTVVLMWCHHMTRLLRYDPRLNELRQQSKR